jgi:hypothetical protein
MALSRSMGPERRGKPVEHGSKRVIPTPPRRPVDPPVPVPPPEPPKGPPTLPPRPGNP